MHISITGANGFVGQELCRTQGRQYRFNAINGPSGSVPAPALSDNAQWVRLLQGSEVVVHLAGRAHVLREEAEDPLAEFRRVNVAGAIHVARSAIEAGVRRFVFVSSIGVLGSSSDEVLSEASRPAPTEPYAVSKYEAELALRELAGSGTLELVIVRPPLIYGPGAKGNFLRLLKLVDLGLPLPLGSLHEPRSFIGVRNLCGALLSCATLSEANGETFVVSDGEDISTAELIATLARAMNKGRLVWRFPPSLLKLVTAMLGKSGEFARLSSRLQVDSSHIRTTLGWTPEQGLREGLTGMAEWFMRMSRP